MVFTLEASIRRIEPLLSTPEVPVIVLPSLYNAPADGVLNPMVTG